MGNLEFQSFFHIPKDTRKERDLAAASCDMLPIE